MYSPWFDQVNTEGEMSERRLLSIDRDVPFLVELTELVTKWKEVGDHLGVPVHELDAIQENNRGAVHMTQACLRDMFIWWLRNGKEKTVKKLKMAIHAVGRHEVEMQINRKYGIPYEVGRSLSVPELHLPDYVQKYCKDTKARYMLQSVLPELDWPPTFGRQYIRLALINQERPHEHHIRFEDVIKQQTDYTRGDYDKILEYKTKIELETAFGPVICEGGNEINPLRMLVDGAPGVGKTTLSRKVSRMWAEDELLQKYWLVLLLPLRERGISKAKTIDEFFYHEDSELQCKVVSFVKEVSGDGVLLIFDGFDELSSYERSEHSLFLDVSMGKVLPKCAVVITSRPYASRSLQVLSSIKRHIEVLGFTDEQVKMCIKQKIKDQTKAEELCTELKDRLDIASICQIPLNCSIVLYVYEQENYRLPRTLTELYDLFVLHSLKRFLTRTQNTSAADRLLNLNNLQSPSKENLASLCNLAYKGLEDDKLVFFRNDIEKYFLLEYQESSTHLPLLDLMTSAKSYSSRGAQNTYSFLHLTIQEFLAAYWVAHYLSDTEKLELFQKKLMDNRFRMVLLFLSGMTKLTFPCAFSIFSQICWKEEMIHACHLLYESGYIALYNCVSEKYISPKIVSTSGSSFDVLVVSYFVAYSNSKWNKIELRPTDVMMVHKVFSSCQLNTSIQAVRILFRHRDDLTPVRVLENCVQIIGVTISLQFPDERADQMSMLKEVRNILIGPNAITTKDYTIVLEYISGTASAYRNTFLAQFCEMLAEGLALNSSITGITLNCVSADDVQLIFTRLSDNNSVSNLAYIKCIQSRRKRYDSDITEEIVCKQFCTSLATYISRSKSLLNADLDVPLDKNVVGNHIEVLKSGLAHNTTLQVLSICKGKILFERNQKTNEMDLIKAPKPHALPFSLRLASPKSPEEGYVHGIDSQTTDWLSVSPLARPNSPVTRRPMTPQTPHGICDISQPVFYSRHSGPGGRVILHGSSIQLSPNHMLIDRSSSINCDLSPPQAKRPCRDSQGCVNFSLAGRRDSPNQLLTYGYDMVHSSHLQTQQSNCPSVISPSHPLKDPGSQCDTIDLTVDSPPPQDIRSPNVVNFAQDSPQTHDHVGGTHFSTHSSVLLSTTTTNLLQSSILIKQEIPCHSGQVSLGQSLAFFHHQNTTLRRQLQQVTYQYGQSMDSSRVQDYNNTGASLPMLEPTSTTVLPRVTF